MAMQMGDRCRLRGYLSQSIDDKAFTALLVAKLIPLMSTFDAYNSNFVVMHQPLACNGQHSGYVDMVVYYELPRQSTSHHSVGELLPFVFMEFTGDNIDDEQHHADAAQSTMYASYLFRQLMSRDIEGNPTGTPFPLLGFRVSFETYICSMYHVTVVDHQYQVNK